MDYWIFQLANLNPIVRNIYALPYEYTPNAREPKRFKQFLQELFPDDVEAERLLQEYIGLLLTPDTRFQKILLIQGPKRSGKGTIEHVITELIGKDNVTNPTMTSLSTQFGLAPLINKSVAIIPDARVAGSSNKAVELLLSVSGEDRLNIDRKNKTHWVGKLSARFVILTNELPKLLDVSGALASRFLIISLQGSFLDESNWTLRTSY
jgi:putative DNA primase/helicase